LRALPDFAGHALTSLAQGSRADLNFTSFGVRSSFKDATLLHPASYRRLIGEDESVQNPISSRERVDLENAFTRQFFQL
jgi:hypothetical protein